MEARSHGALCSRDAAPKNQASRWMMGLYSSDEWNHHHQAVLACGTILGI